MQFQGTGRLQHFWQLFYNSRMPSKILMKICQRATHISIETFWNQIDPWQHFLCMAKWLIKNFIQKLLSTNYRWHGGLRVYKVIVVIWTWNFLQWVPLTNEVEWFNSFWSVEYACITWPSQYHQLTNLSRSIADASLNFIFLSCLWYTERQVARGGQDKKRPILFNSSITF